MNNWGYTFYLSGDLEKAIEYYEKALNINLENFGEKNTEVAVTLNNLGMSYYSKKEYKKELDHYKKSEKVFTQTLGDDHAYTKSVKKNIKKTFDKI